MGGRLRRAAFRDAVLFQKSAYLQVMCLQMAVLLVDSVWSAEGVLFQNPAELESRRLQDVESPWRCCVRPKEWFLHL